MKGQRRSLVRGVLDGPGPRAGPRQDDPPAAAAAPSPPPRSRGAPLLTPMSSEVPVHAASRNHTPTSATVAPLRSRSSLRAPSRKRPPLPAPSILRTLSFRACRGISLRQGPLRAEHHPTRLRPRHDGSATGHPPRGGDGWEDGPGGRARGGGERFLDKLGMTGEAVARDGDGWWLSGDGGGMHGMTRRRLLGMTVMGRGILRQARNDGGTRKAGLGVRNSAGAYRTWLLPAGSRTCRCLRGRPRRRLCSSGTRLLRRFVLSGCGSLVVNGLRMMGCGETDREWPL